MSKIKFRINFKRAWLDFKDRYLVDHKEDFDDEEDTEVMRLRFQLEEKDKKIDELKVINATKEEMIDKLLNRIDNLNMKITELYKEKESLSGDDLCKKIEEMIPNSNEIHTDTKE